MKIIFLDIDGVVTSARVGWFHFDENAVNFIKWLTEKGDCKVVISSGWRHAHSQKFFAEHFDLHEHWRTPSVPNRKRGEEIDVWLKQHPEIMGYVILDDDTDMLENQMANFVHTCSTNGLLYDHMHKVKDILGLQIIESYNESTC